MPDRVREALFLLLRGHTEGQAVADVFAGTGAVGLEAISRGAARCVFVERDREIANILRANVESLGVGDRCEVVQGDALGGAALSRCPRPVHLVFFDPPYPMVTDPATRPRVFDQFARFIELLDPEGFAVLRTPWPFLESPAGEPPARPRRERIREADILRGDDDNEEVERDDVEADSGAASAAAAKRDRPRDVDLTIPGARGPETHVYSRTAVHLYVKAGSAFPASS